MDLTPVLKRFQQRFYKKNGSGEIIPASGTTVKFYQPGATVVTQTTVYDSGDDIDPVLVDVPVYQVAGIVFDDQLQNGGKEADVMTVFGVNAAAGTITVVNRTGHDFTLATDARLIRTGKHANAYADPLGTVLIGTSMAADADGWVECYLRDYRFDLTVPEVGIRAAYADAVGSWVTR